MKRPVACVRTLVSLLLLSMMAEAGPAGAGEAPLRAQSTRMASDFEIAQTERQLTTTRDFISQLSGRLNLGDLRLARNESSLARAEYEKALAIAMRERLEARKASSLSRYADATGYAGLAQAKLGNAQNSFELMEEAVRYAADNAKSWNLYATAMSLLHQPRKASSVARNAVAVAEVAVRRESTISNRLDLAVYRHSLASALLQSGGSEEAERLLVDLTSELRSPLFADLQRNIERKESFEIYSSARGDEATYLSLLNRAQLRLGGIYEARGSVTQARQQYERVLEGRTDDPIALAGLARLSTTDDARERYFQEAFDANPFSIELARDYQRHLNGRSRNAGQGDINESTGSRVRLALRQIARGDTRAAASTLDSLLARYPDNDSLRLLRREAEGVVASVPHFLTDGEAPARSNSSPPAKPVSPITPNQTELRELLSLLAGDRLTPDQRVRLDGLTFSSAARFEPSPDSAAGGQTVFEAGSIDDVSFRFSEPTLFRGDFTTLSLRLTYRILGVSQRDGHDVLLVEPLRLEAIP